jgi:hypothetical protein
MINFRCPCGQTMAAQDHDAGQVTKCPRCGNHIHIPGTPIFQPEAVAPKPRTASPGGSDIAAARPRRPDYEGEAYDGRRPKQSSGGGCVVVGIIVVGLLCLLGIVAVPILVFGLLPATQKIREAAARVDSANNLKSIALGMVSYHDVYKKLPNHAIYSKEGRPLLSWRVAILPFLGEEQLWRQFNLEESWDSPHNRPLLEKIPKVYVCALAPPESAKQGSTYYQAFVGDPKENFRPVFVRNPLDIMSLAKISAQDGAGQTILVIESNRGVPWTAPDDIEYGPNTALPRDGPIGQGFQAAFADSSVHYIRPTQMDDRTLRNAITINDGGPPIRFD